MTGTIPPPLQFPLPPMEDSPLDKIEEGNARLFLERSGSRVSLIIQTSADDPDQFSEIEVHLETPGFPKGITCRVERCLSIRSGCWELVLEPESQFEAAALKRLLAAGISSIAGCELHLDGKIVELRP